MLERVAVCALLILATVSVYSPWVSRWLNHSRSVPALLWVFALSRIATWLGCYVLIPGLVRNSDLAKYYYPQALEAAQGRIPYTEFATSYGPLFPYLAGVLLPVWDSHAAIALVMVACEILAVVLLCSIARRFQLVDSPGASDPLLARALFLYTLSPAALYWSGMIAYNSSVVLLFWVGAVGLLFAQRFGSSLIALALSALAGKALGLLIAPLWIADSRRRVAYIAGAAAIGIAAILIARHYELDLLTPLLVEGQLSTSGNVWFLLSGIVTLSPDSVIWKFAPLASFALATGLFIAMLWPRWKRVPSLVQFSAAIATVGWLFMVLSKKAYPHYTPMFVLFCVLALSAGRPKGIWILLLALVGAIGIVEPGLWNALGQPDFLSDACRGDCRKSYYYGLIASDAVIVSIQTYLAIICARLACNPSIGRA